MKKIVMASHNPGKIQDFKILFQEKSVDIIPQAELQVPDIPETGLTFVENAILKARNACHYTNLPAIADDTGLEVDALDGAPGIYSARYAGEHATYKENYSKLLQALEGVEPAKRTARFRSVIVYLKNEKDPSPIITQGIWEGVILNEPIGNQGFGYMPVFYLPDQQCSGAQLTLSERNKISHRFHAMKQMFIALSDVLDKA